MCIIIQWFILDILLCFAFNINGYGLSDESLGVHVMYKAYVTFLFHALLWRSINVVMH